MCVHVNRIKSRAKNAANAIYLSLMTMQKQLLFVLIVFFKNFSIRTEHNIKEIHCINLCLSKIIILCAKVLKKPPQNKIFTVFG